MSKLIHYIVIIALSAVVNVNSLQCYECLDCTKVSDDLLVTCEASTTTSSTTQTTPVPGQSTTPGSTTTLDPATTPTETTTPGSATTSSSTTTPTPSTTPASATTSSTSTTTPAPDGIDENENNPSGGGTNSYIVSRAKRSVLVQERAAEYVCLTVKLEVNNTEVIARGCALDAGDGKICEELGIANATCTACKTDKCNSAVSIQLSFILVVVAVLIGSV